MNSPKRDGTERAISCFDTLQHAPSKVEGRGPLSVEADHAQLNLTYRDLEVP